MQAAAKVGGLVILFGAMGVGVFAVLQQNAFAVPTKPYRVVFADAGGLTSGARVTMSGVKVGFVEAVVLESPGKAVAKIRVEEAYKIPEGSVAVLPGSLITIGDKEVQIVPSKSVAMLDVNGEIPGSIESPLTKMFPDTGATLENVNKTLISVQKLLGDKDLKDGLVGMMNEGQNTARSFNHLANTLDHTVARSSTKVDAILATTANSLENMEAVSLEIKKLVASGELEGKAMKLLDSLDAAVVQGRQLMEDFHAMAADPEMQASLRNSIANMEKMTDSGTRIAADMELVSKNGVTMSEEGTQLMKKANELAEEVHQLIADFKGAVEKFGPVGAAVLPNISYEASLTYEMDGRHLRTDANVFVPMGKDQVMLGLHDAFESNKLNLMLQKRFGDSMSLRYGVYASKPGVGVDYRVAPSLFLRGDLYGLNDTQFDLRMRYDFGGGVQGWAGMESIFDRNSPSIGIGIKR
jgi:hypothetical protein